MTNGALDIPYALMLEDPGACQAIGCDGRGDVQRTPVWVVWPCVAGKIQIHVGLCTTCRDRLDGARGESIGSSAES